MLKNHIEIEYLVDSYKKCSQPKLHRLASAALRLQGFGESIFACAFFHEFAKITVSLGFFSDFTWVERWMKNTFLTMFKNKKNILKLVCRF